MPFNEKYSFTDMPPHVQAAFKYKHDKVLLHKGMKLYRFGSDQTLVNPRTNLLPNWWSPYEAYEHDPGWEQKKNFARHMNISVRELARVLAALPEQWSSAEYLLTATLSVDIYAFFGNFAQQNTRQPLSQWDQQRRPGESIAHIRQAKTNPQPINLPGGGTQFYIPDFNQFYISSHQFTSYKMFEEPKFR